MSDRKRGKFIVLEGGEGSGKSSALRWLKEELSDFPIVFTREPGGVFSAEEIREVVLKKHNDPLDPFTQILLFEAARREHVLKKIIPALEKGVHIICDRFSSATYAYQIVAAEREEYEKIFLMIDTISRNNIDPDKIIFLDVDPEEGIKRKNSAEENLNVFDEKDMDFHFRVQEGMKKYIKSRSHTYIDANKSKRQVRETIKQVVLGCIQ